MLLNQGFCPAVLLVSSPESSQTETRIVRAYFPFHREKERLLPRWEPGHRDTRLPGPSCRRPDFQSMDLTQQKSHRMEAVHSPAQERDRSIDQNGVTVNPKYTSLSTTDTALQWCVPWISARKSPLTHAGLANISFWEHSAMKSNFLQRLFCLKKCSH